MASNLLRPLSWATFVCMAFFSCTKAPLPTLSTDEFQLQEGFEISLVASEPLLNSPMAMTFDHQGRIWVVEMPGYMRDIDGRDEKLPDGKIVLLEDTDHDGRMDQRTVILDSLLNPRAVALAYGGLLFTETPNLWWVPLDGDQPGERVLVDSLYVIGGNIEHQPNGLLYNLDNWLYSAKSNARYRRKDGKWLKEVTRFRGQWGISQDNEGRLFYNSNSTPLECDFTFPNQFINNPYYKASVGVGKKLDPDRRMYPLHATAVNRGYTEGVLDSLGRVMRFTSACGPVVYRGDQFPAEFQGNAFICGPEGNLVKRYLLSEEQGRIVAEQAYQEAEFLASSDDTFRPVNLYTGPDGALYVLDLRKGIIQHRAYMSSYLRDQILQKGLDTVQGLGRIYKITATDQPIGQRPEWSRYTPEDYVSLLKHPNGQLRNMAQQFLVFGNHSVQAPALQALARDASAPYGQLHALWTLEGLDLLTADLLADAAANSDNPLVLVQVLRLVTRFPAQETAFMSVFQKALSLQSATVDLQLCYALGEFRSPPARQLWQQLAEKYSTDPLYSEALVSGIPGQEQVRLAALRLTLATDTLVAMLGRTLRNIAADDRQAPEFRTEEFLDSRTQGASLYSTFCATCHGMDGKGIADLAPPLYHSEYVTESAERLILIALHGLQGPITVNRERYEMNAVMPGIKDNPELDDDEIATILRFVGNGFNPKQVPVSAEKVKRIRQMTADREELFTAESLEQWLEENLGPDKSLTP